ncbi:flagellar basal-body rod protein FlgB [Nitrosospira sp. Nsp18]|uniref:flagellar basal body rod protein FlgB n=1 Tax=Nitrosospira sp. Nsp18 TaxID=1855334 RepID=UPI000891BAA1|nr:flagellar basal body rod protein FlgB [Nitrosospira sp. Nsp18]SDA11963.1 flagellar basal-body rod protein FlgB [Nitrosospira sp. Nsp18]
MINKLDATFRFYEDAANLRAHRQQLIASNIANVDTPNFKARDINFKDALENAGGNKIVKLATNAPNHIASPGSSGGPAAAGAPLMYRAAIQGSVDGNTVDMDIERSQFADNAIHYEANLTFISDQIKIMRSAIQG